MLRENANFSSSRVCPIPRQREATKSGERCSSPTTWGGWGVDIVKDVYKLLVLAGRMHNCLVRDANL